MYSGLLYQVYHYLAKIPPKIKFQNKNPLAEDDKKHLSELFAKGYYIILTGNNYHLSSVAVKTMSWFKMGKYSRYSHVFMNCDNLTDSKDVDSFKFMEATVKGVHYSSFTEVFDCDTVCVLTPRNISNRTWTKIIDGLLSWEGYPYDDLFQLADNSHISCVELVRLALMKDPRYQERFCHLEKMIFKEGNLLPQMFRDCPDFDVVWENK